MNTTTHRLGEHLVSEPLLNAPAAPGGFLARLAAGLAVVVGLGIAAGVWWSNGPRTPDPESGQVPVPATPTPTKGDGQELFAGWPKEAPDLVLVFTGQTYGYLQPCGCSRPQQGGLERRYNFVQSLKAKGWNVVALDVGDVLPKPPETPDAVPVPAEQTFKKYEYAMKAYKEIGYAAVGVGEYDFKRDLFELLPRYALNNPDKPPFILAGNVAGAERDPTGKVTKVTPRDKFFGPADGKSGGRDAVGVGMVVAEKGKLPFGVIGVVAPSVADAVTEGGKKGPLTFTDHIDLTKKTLTAFADNPAKPELNVLLLQGNITEARDAADAAPGVQVIACLSDAAASDPPGVPTVVAKTNQQIVQLGHKGRYVGVLGVFKGKQGFGFRYQLVSLGEEYVTPETPEAEKANKVLQLLEEYAKDVKDGDLLAKYTAKRPPHPASVIHDKAGLKYVGSETCRKCHAAEFKVWSGHPHSHAYEALEKKAKRPANQQFNGECLACHTTGFKYDTGFVSKEKTPALLNNGCENCHGPGSGHSANDKDPDLLKALMPWRSGPGDKLPPKAELEKYAAMTDLERARADIPNDLKRLMNVKLSGQLCMKCHDGDNDPKFNIWTYMPKVYHSGLKQGGLPGGIGK